MKSKWAIQFFLFFFIITPPCLSQTRDIIVLPSPEIGWDSLQNKFIYPDIAARAVLWGAYEVNVLIDSTGKLIDIDIENYELSNFKRNFKDQYNRYHDSPFISSIKYELNDVRWNPGLINNQPKTMRMVIPIVYYFGHRRNSAPTLFIKTDPQYPLYFTR